MSTKVSVYIATSLDGFIARKDGGIDWLPTGDESGEDFGYAEFMSTIDHLVMGRNTYETALTFGEWPYTGRKVTVLSSKNIIAPSELEGKVSFLNQSPHELVKTLEGTGTKHIYLDGGNTIQRFLREHLVHEMTITQIPILIGEGLPLFGKLDTDVNLQLIGSTSFKNGFVQSKYTIK